MPIAIDRTQTRFKEDPNRFDIPTKPKRNTHKDDVQPETGHQSVNPGPWVTEIALGLTEASLEQRESVEAILESYYRLRPRYVTLRYPLNVVVGQLWEKELPATEFREETVLDNKSLCFGVAVREPKDESAPFKYMEQPNVLDGADLQQYLAGRQSLVSYWNDKDHESKQGQIERKSRRKQETKKERRLRLKTEATPKIKAAPVVPDELVDAHYATWAANPSAENRELFFGTMGEFIIGKIGRMAPNNKLAKRGFLEELGQEFLIKMMEKIVAQLAAGKLLNQPSHYITRAWSNAKFSEYKVRAEADLVTVSIDGQVEDADGEKEDIDLSDSQRYKSWARVKNAVVEQHAVVEPTKEERGANRKVKHSALAVTNPALADLVGMFVVEKKTQTEVAKAQGITQQAVSKRKKKASELLKAMPDVVPTT